MKTVTPAMARSLISIAETKRPWDMRKVEYFAACMRDNQWAESASVTDPIHVVNGRLVNGKLRLAALSRAGVTLRMAFVYDDNRSGSEYVGRHRRDDRRFGDGCPECGMLIQCKLSCSRREGKGLRYTL